MSDVHPINPTNRLTLMLALHEDINNVASYVTEFIMSGNFKPTYPPNEELSLEERDALSALKAIPSIESALKKVIRDVASSPLFLLFTYLDGVTEPTDDESWSGVALIDMPEDEAFDEELSSEEMLHDNFFGTYWDWKEKKQRI
jgi:hypothetical protein